jgi:hypothetical protein
MRSSTHTVNVVSLARGLPIAVVDDILTATEEALVRLGATRVWVDPAQPGLAVMAELPADVLRALEDASRAASDAKVPPPRAG